MLKMKKLSLACTLAVAGMFGAAPAAQAQISGDVIKIGFITDMSGLYADIDGPAGAEMIKQAVARNLPVVAFGPHVDVDGRQRAKAAGARRVLSNGNLSRDLPAILKEL